MQYRRLGRTELQTSLLGMGGGYLMLLEEEMGTQLYQRAVDRGVNYFDGRYGDSSVKLRPVIKQDRQRFIVVSKTAETKAEGVLHRIDEDLSILDTPYLDIYFLRCYNMEMLEERLAPGGAFEGLQRARDQGKIHFTGLANHSEMDVLVAGIETGLVDVVIFPLNIVRREALDTLIPVAQQHDVGLVVMKPLSVGKIPVQIGLRWLVQQPIHTIVPGMSSFEHLEIDLAAVEKEGPLTAEEEKEIERYRQTLDQVTCRICDKICKAVCEKNLPIDWMIHHDVLYEHFRNLGLEGYLNFPFTTWVKKETEAHFSHRLEAVRSCTRCGLCEKVCPYHLPIMDMLEEMLENHQQIIEAVRAQNWAEENKEAEPPYKIRAVK